MSAFQKVTIIGMSATPPGAISKAGKAYSIGRLYTTAPLALPLQEGGIEKGFSGTEYDCSAELVRKIAHLPVPVQVEMETETVMRFGKAQVQVIDVKPVSIERKAA